jgi:hypothetical protein
MKYIISESQYNTIFLREEDSRKEKYRKLIQDHGFEYVSELLGGPKALLRNVFNDDIKKYYEETGLKPYKISSDGMIMYIDDFGTGAVDFQDWYRSWSGSSSPNKGQCVLIGGQNLDSYEYILQFNVLSVEEKVGYFKIGVSYINFQGTIQNNDYARLSFTRTGDIGLTGSAGTSGSSGVSGTAGTSGTSPVGRSTINYTTENQFDLDASVYVYATWVIGNNTIARTLNVSNLAVGQEVVCYIQNTNAGSKTFNFRYNTATFNITNGIGALITSATLAQNQAVTITVRNVNGTIVGSV